MLPLLATIRSLMPSPLRSASCTAPGASRPVERLPTTVCLAPAVIDDDAVQALVGEDEVLGAVTEIGHGQRDVLVGSLVRLERAVAVAQQHQHVAELVADQQIELAVAVDIGDGQARGVVAGIEGPGRAEAPRPVEGDRPSPRRASARPAGRRPSPAKSATTAARGEPCVKMVFALAKPPPGSPVEHPQGIGAPVQGDQVGASVMGERCR